MKPRDRPAARDDSSAASAREALGAGVELESAVRAEVRAFLESSWDPELTVAAWWERLGDSGWAVPTWPREWLGRGLSRALSRVVDEEIRAAGALGPPAGLGMLLAGPTILRHGTDEQRATYLPPIVKGTASWCQLFSEPSSGSDLASLQTRAERDGDEWVVTGQKVWASAAHMADFGMLLARTDRRLPKHDGITYFLLPLDQAGVEVRPLREMTGRSLFTEVFLDGARVPDSAVLGGVGNGWAVANTTLEHERSGLGSGGSGGAGGAYPGRKAGVLDRRAGDLAGGAGGRAAQSGRIDRVASLLRDLCRTMARANDPVLRQQLAELYTLHELGRMTALRSRAAREQGRKVGPEANIAKLLMTRIARLSADLGLAAIGPHGMLLGSDGPGGGAVQAAALWAPAVSIFGGSDEIQRNIVAERVLGLAREQGPNRDTPFDELPVSTVRTA